MSLKRIFILFICFGLLKTAVAQELTAGMGKVKVSFSINEKGMPLYSITYDQKAVINSSSLGFDLVTNAGLTPRPLPFSNGFELTGSEQKSADETWHPVLGEVSTIRDHYNQLTIHLKKKNTDLLLDIVFRVFEDGVGFRYEFPKQKTLNYFTVANELTQFNLAGNYQAFWIPGDYDTNEYPYTKSKISEIDNQPVVNSSTDICVRNVVDRYAVQTPLMMKSDDGLYINIHEAALLNYSAMQLHVDTKTQQLTSSLVPDATGNKAYLKAPCHTPWRTVIVSNKAADILASRMILNLNEPSKIENTSWIKPMKFVGVWWEMQTGKGTWAYSDYADSVDATGKAIPNGKHCGNTNNVKRYIDFAAKNGIDAVLVEGWNTGWEDAFGAWKEKPFDFVTPYPDFNVKELQEYAAKKGVKIIMHNETCGGVTNYERQLDTAFRFMKNNGYSSVKTGYVGKIIPRGEYHDGQWMVNHYVRVAQKAADYNIMIDVHEPMRPTGIQRTYPNWVASEAGRGNEYNAFSHGSPCDHETILPFTRLMGGPMDYTPGIFKLRYYSSDSTRQLHSTLAKQLALYVTIYSPLQMAADLPENYEAHPDAFQFIKDVPVDWDTTNIIAAEPGDYVVMARKGKGTDNWFVGAITDETSRNFTVDLSFLDKGKKYMATVYGDAANADWKTNPEAYAIKKITVTNKSRLSLSLANGGGAAVSIVQVR
ncbi:glycoside hydrolase family 97 protein [Ferruginibacter albus]|uniref:glycoside hydrolase family 97 protein n=1 Tax=Ferruginibacter albus TaxID=2875540 RepID=UPI001CC3A504|nr:glycoside hydrolase family 97 protein [Ferruginibacter albus]UAY51213.1 glycoside hydrolase family 97 protein [Ferruginibacter albus]